MGLRRWFRRGPTPQQYVEAEQRAKPLQVPPGPQGDFAQRRFAQLLPRMPEDLRRLYQSGGLALGELGDMSVNAFTAHVRPGNYAILFHTGMTRFLYRVSRLMHTQVRVFSGSSGQHVTQPSIPLAQTVSVLEKVFRTYMSTRQITGLDYEISQQQKELASELAAHAETFVIAHEVGHVAIWRRDGVESPRSPQQELEADALAVEYVLGVNGQPEATKDISLRMAYAGIEFASRVFSGLQHLGDKFGTSHPLPATRLLEVRKTALRLLGRRRFLDVSTMAMANDQLLEELERRLVPPGDAAGFVLGLTLDRVLSTLSVLVEEVAKQRMEMAFAVQEAEQLFSLAAQEIVRSAAAEAAEMYRSGASAPTAGDDGGRAIVKYAVFVQFAETIAEPWRQILLETIYGERRR